MTVRKIKRAYSVSEIQSLYIPKLPFENEWEAAFGQPGKTGTWLIWGQSGNGKSSFVIQLAKYLCKFAKVAYNSLEESTGLSLQKSLILHDMQEVSRRFLILDRESMEDLSIRLNKKRSPDIVIIDSFQYSGLTYASYKKLKEAHPNKLLIFVSHAEGINPEGRAAKKVMYDADVKIFVQGFRAVCKGRFITEPGNHFTVWEKGAAMYYNQ